MKPYELYRPDIFSRDIALFLEVFAGLLISAVGKWQSAPDHRDCIDRNERRNTPLDSDNPGLKLRLFGGQYHRHGVNGVSMLPYSRSSSKAS